jgi:hypothetical protein
VTQYTRAFVLPVAAAINGIDSHRKVSWRKVETSARYEWPLCEEAIRGPSVLQLSSGATGGRMGGGHRASGVGLQHADTPTGRRVQKGTLVRRSNLRIRPWRPIGVFHTRYEHHVEIKSKAIPVSGHGGL